MKKSLEQALVQAIVCLLKLHLGHSDMCGGKSKV